MVVFDLEVEDNYLPSFLCSCVLKKAVPAVTSRGDVSNLRVTKFYTVLSTYIVGTVLYLRPDIKVSSACDFALSQYTYIFLS